MKPIYLERHDPGKNLHRFYQLHVPPGLFGDWAWALVKEWSRVGSPGTVHKEWFTSEREAERTGLEISRTKQKKGYQLLRDVVQ